MTELSLCSKSFLDQIKLSGICPSFKLTLASTKTSLQAKKAKLEFQKERLSVLKQINNLYSASITSASLQLANNIDIALNPIRDLIDTCPDVNAVITSMKSLSTNKTAANVDYNREVVSLKREEVLTQKITDIDDTVTKIDLWLAYLGAC